MRPVFFLAVILAGCVADRAPSRPAPDPVPADPVAATPPASDREEPTDASVTLLDASSEASIDAQVDAKPEPPPPPPIVLKGVRKCDEAEVADEVCFEGTTAGVCYEGYCITPNVCPRYCAAIGQREFEDCPVGDVKECAGIPECIKIQKQVLATCKQIQKNMTDDCVRITCALVRSLPPRQ